MQANTSKQRLKVLFIATGYPTSDRPNQNIFTHRSIKQLSEFIDGRIIHFRSWRPGRPFIQHRVWDGIQVITVACPQFPGGPDFHINTKLLTWFGGIFTRSLVKKADLIHSLDLYPSGFIANRWARAAGKPNTTHVIGSDLNLFLAPKLSEIGKAWLYKIHGLACNSFALKKTLDERVPDLNNPRVIYRGVDPNIFSPEGPVCGAQSQLHPVKFLYLGGFHTWDRRNSQYYNIKGGPILLDAWKKVEEQINPSSLLIGGPGLSSGHLEEWRATLHRPESVFFLEAKPPEEIPSLLRSCDVVVIPSLQEGLPNIANEAQACGRPVLCSDAGGLPESVEHTKTGWVVSRGDVDALVAGFEWFSKHVDDIPVMGGHARERMLQNFSVENFIIRMMELFDNAVRH